MLDKHLPEVEPLEGIGGRLWDISRPLFQLALLVAPETFEMVRTVVLGMEGQKVETKRDTLEGKIVDAIDKLVDRKAPEHWEVPFEKIRSHVNATIANDQYHYTSQKIGRRIESLGVESKKNCGLARVRITARELDMLKEQHGLLEPSLHQKTRPLSNTRQDAANTGLHAGRELQENRQLGPASQNQKPIEIKADGRVVEIGSESPTLTAATAEKYHQAYLALINDTLEPKTTAPAERGEGIVSLPLPKRVRKNEPFQLSKTRLTIGTGCPNGCKYCYARDIAVKNKMITDCNQWITERVNQRKAEVTEKVDGRIMFPTMHDITTHNLQTYMVTLRNILKAGNRVLIVSKPRLTCIQSICDEFIDAKDNILFRFTIGSQNEGVCKFGNPTLLFPKNALQR